MSGAGGDTGVRESAGSNCLDAGTENPGRPSSPLTADDVRFVENWARHTEGASEDVRYYFGDSEFQLDFKRRANLLRRMLAHCTGRSA